MLHCKQIAFAMFLLYFLKNINAKNYKIKNLKIALYTMLLVKCVELFIKAHDFVVRCKHLFPSLKKKKLKYYLQYWGLRRFPSNKGDNMQNFLSHNINFLLLLLVYLEFSLFYVSLCFRGLKRCCYFFLFLILIKKKYIQKELNKNI